MAPLIPQGIIDAEWGYVIALIIGIGFGFILEQAGFSTSRKLVGLFYGYDFTVLRVFFTAAITAMVGLLYFSYFDIIDMNLIFVNPTYLWSTIVGGLIMGLGFIIGGFCPGTSICALAIGKLDALCFVCGIILGVFIFGESFSIFEGLYKAAFMGRITVFEQLGLSAEVFGFLLIVVAIIAFIVTSKIENKKKKVDY